MLDGLPSAVVYISHSVGMFRHAALLQGVLAARKIAARSVLKTHRRTFSPIGTLT